MSILDDLPDVVAGALGDSVFFDGSIARDVPAAADTDKPWKSGGAATTTTFTCKAMIEQYGAGLRRDSLVNAGDVKVLVLAATLSTEPKPLDRITMTTGPHAGVTFSVVPSSTPGGDAVRTDPARAVWELRARR